MWEIQKALEKGLLGMYGAQGRRLPSTKVIQPATGTIYNLWGFGPFSRLFTMDVTQVWVSAAPLGSVRGGHGDEGPRILRHCKCRRNALHCPLASSSVPPGDVDLRRSRLACTAFVLLGHTVSALVGQCPLPVSSSVGIRLCCLLLPTFHDAHPGHHCCRKWYSEACTMRTTTGHGSLEDPQKQKQTCHLDCWMTGQS